MLTEISLSVEISTSPMFSQPTTNDADFGFRQTLNSLWQATADSPTGCRAFGAVSFSGGEDFACSFFSLNLCAVRNPDCILRRVFSCSREKYEYIRMKSPGLGISILTVFAATVFCQPGYEWSSEETGYTWQPAVVDSCSR
jgi:hypothetical protein